jgi:hypothetical protein
MSQGALAITCHDCQFDGVFRSHFRLRQEGFTIFINARGPPDKPPDVQIRCKCGSMKTRAAGTISPPTHEPLTVVAP